MKVTDFTEDNEVLNVLFRLKDHFLDKEFVISDVTDDRGHQYVDLVQEGGGVLGIALLGYTYVLERLGIRFLNLAGTSAGAINAMLLAACGQCHEEKTVKLLEIMAEKDLRDFVDGDKDVRELLIAYSDKKPSWRSRARILFRLTRVFDSLRELMGLNPGLNFTHWMKSELNKLGVKDTATLLDRMKVPDHVKFRLSEKERPDLKHIKIGAKLAVIAADISTESKVEFPEMRGLFFHNPEEVHPAEYVRASMSIPIFYKPVVFSNLPKDLEIKLKWKRLVGYQGDIPQRALLVDGGVMSNFPIDLFHRTGVPTRPTFGVQLGLNRTRANQINNIFDLAFASFNAVRNLRDYEFIQNNPDYKQLVKSVDLSDFDWLNFSLSDDEKIGLFVAGAKAAEEFIKLFDWSYYKETRGNLLTATDPIALFAIIDQIQDIVREKKQDTVKNEILLLERRLYELTEKLDITILWIDDYPELIKQEVEAISKIGATVVHYATSQEAIRWLEENVLPDIIVSDMNRENNRRAGKDFAKELYGINATLSDRLIFYITDLNEELGVPEFAFGITETVTELLHLILDILNNEENA